VVALLGENGAGKSTLMNVLYGLVAPDTGRIVVRGEDHTAGWSTRRAIASGIGMIHQHFALVGDYSVLDNVILPVAGRAGFLLDRAAHAARVQRIAAENGIGVPLQAPVESLAVGQRQQVEILKMLYQGARVLVLDEPTSVLTPQQAAALLEMLRGFRARGHAVVLITHKIHDALGVADRVMVLRRGRHVATFRAGEVSPAELARAMIAQDVPPPRMPSLPGAASATVLELENPEGLSLRVRAGEIVGIAGVAGNGQRELAEGILGTLPCAGTLRINGRDVTRESVADRRAAGLAFIPEDRHHSAMVADLAVWQNLLLGRAGEARFSRHGVLAGGSIRAYAGEQFAAFDVRAPSPEVPMRTLSGGNQQKVVLGREISRKPALIVACEPTRGLDFAATAYVRGQLVENAERGCAVLVISSDLEELMEMSHRVAVMFRGRIVGELASGEYDPQRFGLLMSNFSPGLAQTA